MVAPGRAGELPAIIDRFVELAAAEQRRAVAEVRSAIELTPEHNSIVVATTAWMTTTGRPDVTIAVLDSGIEWNNPGAMDDLRFKLRHEGEILSFFSTTMVFGTPVDITLSELALETFFPADERTAERLKQMAAGLQ